MLIRILKLESHATFELFCKPKSAHYFRITILPIMLNESLKNKKLILASGSPRRRQLMADAGLEFSIAGGYEVEEIFPEEMVCNDVASYLASLKSMCYPNLLAADEILITADTTVCFNGSVLGKPVDRADAIGMLQRLSGNRHDVVTGVVLRDIDRTISFSCTSSVWFRELSFVEIEYYVDNFSPYDKAGGYGIQEWIGYVGVERIEGSYFNVMGLPIQRVYVELAKFVDNF